MAAWPNQLLAKELTLNGLYRIICDYFGLEDLEAANPNDKKVCRNARKTFIYLARKYTTSSNGEISDIIGGISHSTVSSSYIRTELFLAKDENHKQEFEEEIRNILRNAGAWPH